LSAGAQGPRRQSPGPVMKRVESAIGAATKVDEDEASRSIELLEQSNNELKEQIRKLHELKECRATMIAHLAHELRTPLTSILGFSEILLSQEKLTDAQRNFCERIQNSAHQLQRNLSQLADLSRMDIVPGDDQPPADS
jgi:signal transduction histidine kinase